MKDSKNLVIGMLCAVVCIMAVAYAAFSTTLEINGTTTIASEWEVRITAVDCVDKAGQPSTIVNKDSIPVDGTTASFTVDFTDPDQYAICTVTIKNEGNLAAKINESNGITITGTNNNKDNIQIKVDTSAMETNPTLLPNAEHKYTISAEYVGDLDNNEETDDIPEDQRTKSVVVSVNYVQDYTK